MMTIVRIVSIIAVILLSTVFAPALVLGDERAVDGQEASVAASEATASGTTARRGAACLPVCEPNYWVLSSRRCASNSDAPCACCGFDYYHVGADGCVRCADEPAFRHSLTPGVPVCIMVHGSFVSQQSMWRDSHHTYFWLRGAAPERPLHVMFYTWPADGFITMVPHVDVAILGRRAEYHGLHLARLVASLPAGHPVCLIGHSHGARLVSSALHVLGGGAVQGCCMDVSGGAGRHLRTVLAAAAIDHDWFNPHARFGRGLCPVEALLNVKNPRDGILCAYPLQRPFSRRALAHSGFTPWDIAAVGWQAAKLAEMDVSDLIGHAHMWPHYYRRPEIACGLLPYVYFPDLDAKRQAGRTATPSADLE